MAFRLLTVVGARPQFIKAGIVSRALASLGDVEESIVHTGQHYDYNMSERFFEEMDIPLPKFNLGISGDTHAKMTGRMMDSLEDVLVAEDPDAVLLYGDTNSTLAAALVAAKIHIPLIHVEAGTRTRSMNNPEEINRICTDHISNLLLSCTEGNLQNLKQEGLGSRAQCIGDPMYSAFLRYRGLAKAPELLLLDGKGICAVPSRYYYLTCHREENTARKDSLLEILSAMDELDAPVIYPVHPRNQCDVLNLASMCEYSNVIFVEPVGYLESIYLVDNAEQVITDSGGLQREAFFAEVKCTTVLDFEVWPETMKGGRNLLASPQKESIFRAMNTPQVIDCLYRPFGDGSADMLISESIVRFLRKGSL